MTLPLAISSCPPALLCFVVLTQNKSIFMLFYVLSLRLRRLWLNISSKYLASHLPFGDVFIKNLSFLHPDLRSSSDLSTSALSVAQKLKRFSAADQICCSNFNLSRPSLKPAARGVWPPAWQNWSLLARRLQDRRQDWGDQYPAEKVRETAAEEAKISDFIEVREAII